MKKTKIKALQNLANRLPLSYEIVKYYTVIQGKSISIEEIIEQRAKGLELEFEPDNWYRQNKSKLQEINHLNRLKKAYTRNKEQGLVDYIQWLNNHNIKLNQTFKDMKLQEVDENILKIAVKGAKVFWSSLIQFLLSFFIAFKSEK